MKLTNIFSNLKFNNMIYIMKRNVNKYLIAAILLCPLFGSAQTKYIKFDSDKIGDIKYSYEASIEKNDTSRFVYINFQNIEYTYIDDRKSIYLPMPASISLLKDMAADLIAAVAEANKSTMVWSKGPYTITCSDKSNSIFITADGGSAAMNKKGADKLSKWLLEIAK